MKLELTRDNWWQQLDEAPLSALTIATMKGAVSALLHNSFAPILTYRSEYEQVMREVTEIMLDGRPMILAKQDGVRPGLHLVERPAEQPSAQAS